MADFKAKGNAAFSAGNYEEAIEHFTAGIAADSSNHVLFSNRSAAQASLRNYSAALEDAEKVVELKPDWPKGYSRLGAANVGLGKWDDAVEAYNKSLQLEPNNEGTKTALEAALSARAGSRKQGIPGMGNLFGPEFLGRLAMDPRTRSLMSDPGFAKIIQDVQQNPIQNMTKYLKDPRFQQAMQVGLGMNFGMADTEATASEEAPASTETNLNDTSTETEASKQTEGNVGSEPKSAAAFEAEPTSEPMSDEARPGAENKEKAKQEKELGNAAYKAKQFAEAIKHYDAAIALDDSDISFLTNRAAVLFEQADYEGCIKDCDKAVERGRELRLDYKLVGKALTRKGNALVKLERLEEAIEIYHKALTEHRNADTLKRLNDTERRLKDEKEQAYMNLDFSNEEREKGNLAFKEQRYPEAVSHYSEALKRGPPAINPEAYKLFSNRAACFTKLGAYPDGVKDADECIRLKPDFPKGYSRKGHLQFFMKDYDKAIATYQEGLDKADKDNEELKNGISNCLMTINKMRTGQATDEEVKQRQARAMQDPEVQRILTDPVMRQFQSHTAWSYTLFVANKGEHLDFDNVVQVLEDLQTDPKGSQHHLTHPQIRQNIEKLVSAGIVQMR